MNSTELFKNLKGGHMEYKTYYPRVANSDVFGGRKLSGDVVEPILYTCHFLQSNDAGEPQFQEELLFGCLALSLPPGLQELDPSSLYNKYGFNISHMLLVVPL